MRLLITGAVEGLGRALCEQVLNDGHFVVAVDYNEAGLEQLEQQWGSKVAALHTDMSDYTAVLAMLDDFKNNPPFDTVILNAGISATGKFEDIPGSAYQKLMQINAKSPMTMANRLIGSNLVANEGTIVFISSLSHATGQNGGINTSRCEKKAADALSRHLSQDYRNFRHYISRIDVEPNAAVDFRETGE